MLIETYLRHEKKKLSILELKCKKKMAIQFRGGDSLVQKGRGIGGFFRGIAALFRPLFKSAGTTVVKAVKSKTARNIAKQLADQAIDSSLNMSHDMLSGNDLKKSMETERENFRNVGVNIIDNLQNKKRRKKRIEIQPKKLKKLKRGVNLKSMERYE